ncbi:MAG TPA: sigma 54-interacting transcriptional regulator [Candidatus Limnocylindrales bacterium]|nr:sigma 54-interacting transcriptional regulator [Candidatus Limnocylindrales bacterium]
MAGEHETRKVLDGIVRGLAQQPGVALARIWLLGPGDICADCFMRSDCRDQTRCLHLAASAGAAQDGSEDWSYLQGHFRRIPLGTRKVATIAGTGESILIPKEAEQSDWIVRPEWAQREEIQSFAGHPLIFRGATLGVLALFSRLETSPQEFGWLRMFANQAAVAIANARTFESLERAEADLAKHANELRQVIDVAPQQMFIWEADASTSYGNHAAVEYFGAITPMAPMEFLERVTHPEDFGALRKAIGEGFAREEPIRAEVRMRRHDGAYRWFQYQLTPLRNQDGRVARWCGIRVDIDDQKRAVNEARDENIALREHFRQLQQVMDVVPLHMFTVRPDGSEASINQACLNYFGPYGPMGPREFISRFSHPDDAEQMWDLFLKGSKEGQLFQAETRLRGRDGEYRWFLNRVAPLRDPQGKIMLWCGVRTDIHEQKVMQERASQETLALREEIDKAMMFEEIVGASPKLQAVLARVAKVAPTDSTVLITGETGTGKELVARAIHKRSPRAAQAFVSVNCAAIPRDLIASELFGHEKGAFTGALQRRLGRFEVADGGTIFLDEIGELPAETQVALLRVLQEREIERVGGNQKIRVNVRVIAATNRDLAAAMSAGTFRSDLLYRINVFPVEVPPLRERPEDIRLLVEYFIDRFASKEAKKIRRIDPKSLERLQTYPWPGNIRELQNVIERSVIVCDTETFSVDESWLSREAPLRRPLADEIVAQEKQMIEAALAECRGRISGAAGAAEKLGMAPSTLDSKIKALKINKHRYKGS